MDQLAILQAIDLESQYLLKTLFNQSFLRRQTLLKLISGSTHSGVLPWIMLAILQALIL